MYNIYYEYFCPVFAYFFIFLIFPLKNIFDGIQFIFIIFF